MRLRDIKGDLMRLRDMTVDQLMDELTQLKREAFNLRFQRATGQLENTARIGEVRRRRGANSNGAWPRSAAKTPKVKS